MKYKTWTPAVIIALSYVGAFVGAGFISGQELAQFFIRFGLSGIYGWVVVLLVISFGGGYILKYLSSSKPESFDDLVKKHFSPFLGVLINILINGYLAGGLIIMLSGSSGLLSLLVGVPISVSAAIICIAIYCTIIGRGKRLLQVNTYLVPILIVSTLFISIKLLFIENTTTSLWQMFTIKNPSIFLINWWLSAMFYIGYNAIGAIVALVNIAREVTPENGKRGGILGGILIGILGSMLLLTLWRTYPVWQNADLPTIDIINKYYSWFYPIFIPSMLIAMFTVANAYALGISKYVHEKYSKIDLKIYSLLLLAVVYTISLLGFSKLLGIIYPFFGIFATIVLLYMVGRWIIRTWKWKRIL